MLRQRGLLAASLLLTATSVLAAPAPKSRILSDFETPSELAHFTLRATKPASEFSLSNQYVTHGKSSAQVRYPEWQQGSEEWPAIFMSADKGLPSDWSAYDSVAMDVVNTGKADIDLGFYLKDQAGKTLSQHYTLAPDKPTTLRLSPASSSEGFDWSRIAEVHLFATRPPQPMAFVVDNLRLESNLENDLAKAGETIARLEKESAFDSAGLTLLWAKLDGQYRELAMKMAKATSVEDRKTLKSGLEDLKNQLRLQAPRAIDEARMRQAFRSQNMFLPYACGFATSMEKVFPRDVPFRVQISPYGQIEMAGNEVEALQLLIFATESGLHDVKVEVGSLTRADGKATIPASTIKVAPVGFVKTEKPPYDVRYVGWHPDPILDFLKSFNVRQGDLQPVWIQVRTPAGTPEGIYRGEISINPANAEPYRMGLQVKVWGFDLPKETHLRTAMTFTEGALKNAYGTEYERLQDKYYDFILDHRFNPDSIYRHEPPKLVNLQRWNERGLNAFNLLYVNAPRNLAPGADYPEDLKKDILAKLDEIIPQLKEKGLYSKAYLYGFDEISANTFNAMKDIFGTIKARYPDLPLMTTARDNSYGEATKLDCVDMWVPLTPSYYPEVAKKARERGKEVWWYICIGPKEPYANWLIEYDAIDARMLMGIQTAKYQPDGFLYYATNRWPLTKSPITSGPYTDWPPASYNDCNGDGSLICAGPDGPLATIRLENFRDGVEDYEYFWLLRQLVQKLKTRPDAEGITTYGQAREALKIGDTLCKSLHEFSKSPEAIYAKRRQVAEAILAAQKALAR